MTSIITPNQFEEMKKRIKEEYPTWDGDCSTLPIITVKGFINIDEEELKKIVTAEIRLVKKMLNYK